MSNATHPSSRREFLGAAAFALAGLATTARLSAADGSNAPLKRPPNPYVYKFNVGKIEAFSISDGHMLFRQGLELMWPESDRPIMKSALEFNRERLDALPLYVNIMGLRIGDEVALIDAGFGERHPNPNFGWLAEGLRQLGIKPEQVTTGFLSHSHSDHLDGFVDNGKPAFPNARIYLLQEEYDFWRGPNPDFSKSKRDKKPLPNMVKTICRNFEILKDQLVIAKEGKVKKLVNEVEQVSFSGRRAISQGQDITYVTERCVMRLTDNGIVVTEIAPGIHLERDVLDQSEFRLKVAPDLKTMDPSLFQPERIGLVLRGS
jgi:hypothetical protein